MKQCPYLCVLMYSGEPMAASKLNVTIMHNSFDYGFSSLLLTIFPMDLTAIPTITIHLLDGTSQFIKRI